MIVAEITSLGPEGFAMSSCVLRMAAHMTRGVRGITLNDPLIFPRRERGLEQGEESLDGSVLMQ